MKSLISGRPVGEIAVAGRLYVDLHANFMAARTEETHHVLNWYNLGYSGGDGSSGEQGGTFGNFGLDVPWRERTRVYPKWAPVGDVPAVYFDGQNVIKADFPAEADITGEGTVTVELWLRNETPNEGEVVLGWQSQDGSPHSAALPWPPRLAGSSDWRHVVVVAEGPKETWYVDGRAVANRARQLTIGKGHRLILGGASEKAPSFSGHLAAVRVHRGALSAGGVARNARGGVMLGTTLVSNIDLNARPDQGNFYHTWSDADPDKYFTKTSTHFRYRIPYSRLEAKDAPRRKEHDDRIEGMFKLSEACYHAYAEIHALRMPLVSAKAQYRGDGVKYLIHIAPSEGGSWMGWHGDLGFGYPMQAPGHMNPHELVHGVQVQTGGGMQGNYWEVHANFPQTWVGVWQINPAFLAVRDQAMFEATGRSYYHAQLMMRHLAQTPQYGPMFISKLWYSGEKDAYPWITFERFNPDPETSLGYEWARMVQRNVTWDYVLHPAVMPGHPVREDLLLDEIRRHEELVVRHGRVMLYEIPYMPGWYRPAKHYAPQQTGWNLVPLNRKRDRVVVELEGYVNPERGGDWHYGFVAVDGEGVARYSDIHSTSGPLSFDTKPDDRELYFVVAAIPTKVMPINMVGDVRTPAQEPFPYRVRFDGASPRNVALEYYEEKFGAIAGAAHPNGGGFVADTATVADTAYVGPNARVLGNATVSGYARIEDHAIVENATVQDHAVISDFALVQGQAVVKDNARVRDFGRVTDATTLAGDARVLEHAVLQSRKTNSGGVTLKGNAIQHDGDASGTAMIDAQYNKGNTITGGRWLTWSWGQGQNDGETNEDFGGLYADYDFSVKHPWMARDDFGVTWGYLVGGPAFVPRDEAVTTIRYTSGSGSTPGADPTEASSPVPNDGIVEVPVPGWIKARAWKEGMAPSYVVETVYQLEEQREALLFALDHHALPEAGERVDAWGDFRRVSGEAPVALINGVKWYHNDMAGEGNRQTPMLRHRKEAFTDSTAIDGATIVTAVKPVRNDSGGGWNSIVDIFYDQLCLGILNPSGRVIVKVSGKDGRNHLWTAPEDTAIPDGEAGVLSLSVTNTGAFTVYWMDRDGAERKIGSGQGDTPNGFTALTPGANNREFARYITLGRNNPDGWSTFNGYIGDTYVFGKTLGDEERAELVKQTRAAMLSRSPSAEQSPPPRVSRRGDTPHSDRVRVVVATGEDTQYVLALNGRDQFVELPKDVAGLRTATYTAEVKWDGGNGARIFEFRNAQGDAAWLSPSENGRMVFAIRAGDEVQHLSAPALHRGVWTTVQVMIGDEGAMLFVNDEKVAENAGMTLRPESVRATACYLGRGAAGDFFNGRLGRFTVHSVSLVDSQPPTPDPAAFEILPIFVSSDRVVMAAVRGYDPLGGVEYCFEEEGGRWSSPWVKEPRIHVAGRANSPGRYRVKTRDAAGNEGRFSDYVRASGIDDAAKPHDVAPGASTLIEAEHFSRNTPSPDGFTWKMTTDRERFLGKAAMQVLPDRGADADPPSLSAARMDYLVNFAEPGRYFVWVRAFGVNHQGDSVHMGLDMRIDPWGTNVGFEVGRYAWTRREFRVQTPGIHTLSIWMREDGAIVDQILITSDDAHDPS